MNYTKAALTYEQQLELLESRGLLIPSRSEALHWLELIGYYRLSAYFIPFKVHQENRFLPNMSFSMVIDLYQFDAKLRLLIMKSVDLIEIAARAALTYQLAHTIGPFGYLQASSFSTLIPSPGAGFPAQGFDHKDFLARLQKEISLSKEDFVAHYFKTYTSEPHMPIWMATELLTFGVVSKMVGEVPKSTRKQMARPYRISQSQYVSWIRCLAYVRNVCAHHGRLWNRELSIKPELLKEWNVPDAEAGRLYSVCLVLFHLLGRIDPSFLWKEALEELIARHPTANLTAMRFPLDWQTQEPWQPAPRPTK
ncbi:Abi family protein [Acidipila sp. EB88]|uniref:Abi family protein n=1 Tax=Acidipila sp. EB88 TaxID=2305226 RepID=UPI000F5F1B01|nr:Abi family protein [Acidipila sp. EB88]RRA50469.1 hypothetical protein D1Y84_00195 [Acidipila sp. EB88]